jgi:glycerol-1-phosphate dehydrogenase [NAD(P)+]
MLAKHVALFEWRLAHVAVGEWYCPRVAAMTRAALHKCKKSAGGLLRRDAAAVESTVEGLILSGIAMRFAHCTRPASGQEHYFSHMWEMMALERDQPCELHGIQVGVGLNLTLRILEDLLKRPPDFGLARRRLAAFDRGAWERQTRGIFGRIAETILGGEAEQYHQNDPERASARIDAIERGWPEILAAAEEELPDAADILALMGALSMPLWPADLGRSAEDTRNALLGSRDLRDKYLTGSLLWDLGLLQTYADACAE